ncbi:PfkB family carbohydrate kinase [Actinomyces gaoshouyii]|uniref:Ribokinase n=1 Tax=Actinomyces gaoshouyii TaxID=1960083 RepID=A0A8H9HA62_9ACTO|nr:PfkB family carbohydrate kinase [Actinomyces gaoshouyii]ARD41184.1 carbohydrate kinase [Actinomyces gaoshouyii]GGO99624.1 ribokinase [Actinomyces gaoshouyii]
MTTATAENATATPAAPGPAGTALVIGEALVDVVIHPGAEPVDIPGGSPANVALGLARLGRDAELDCWIADDERGRAIRSHLVSDGVRITPGSDGAERTSTAQATIGEDRAATYVFDLDWNPPYPAPAEPPILIHTGSIAAILEPGARTVEQALRDFRASATVCYDPNARPQLMGEPGEARAIVERLVALSDLVKCSDEDVTWFYGIDEGDDAALEGVLEGWLRMGPAIVVVTRGKRGALALTSSGLRLEVPADPSVVVADTVGAGDSFMGGLEDGLWSEGLVGAQQREALRAIDADALERVVRHASRIADITVSRAGANPPTRAELA